jgi:hypothetical protein
MVDWRFMLHPSVVVCAGKELFESFFPAAQQKRLSQLFDWRRDGTQKLTPGLRKRLSTVQALITTWDSPRFSDALRRLDYDQFLSFEWEKKWHPQIPDAEVALPHFVHWVREHWNHA